MVQKKTLLHDICVNPKTNTHLCGSNKILSSFGEDSRQGTFVEFSEFPVQLLADPLRLPGNYCCTAPCSNR